MKINGIHIDDTFAEAFGMQGTRIVITADTAQWAKIAAETMTGFATSVIACGVEAGIERLLPPEETPDGRPGAAVLLFAFSAELMTTAVRNRVGQCILTCPGTACYSGLDSDRKIPLGRALRYFGDGWQVAKRLGDRRYWRIPVMEGEFLVEDQVGITDSIGGGNFLVLGRSRDAVREACERAIVAMRKVTDVVMPFPGGVVRSGSKVGSRYPFLIASTNDAFSPVLKGLPGSELGPEVASVLEIVIDGLTETAIATATTAGLRAILEGGVDSGVTRISAGNYGGNLGAYKFHLRELLK